MNDARPDPAKDPREDIDRELRDLEGVQLPAVEHDDPRLAIPESLRKPVQQPARPGTPPEADKGTVNQLMRISTVGTNFALAVGGLGIIGWAIQRWVVPSAAPWLLVGGLLLGLVVGAVRFVHDAKALMK